MTETEKQVKQVKKNIGMKRLIYSNIGSRQKTFSVTESQRAAGALAVYRNVSLHSSQSSMEFNCTAVCSETNR